MLREHLASSTLVRAAAAAPARVPAGVALAAALAAGAQQDPSPNPNPNYTLILTLTLYNPNQALNRTLLLADLPTPAWRAVNWWNRNHRAARDR